MEQSKLTHIEGSEVSGIEHFKAVFGRGCSVSIYLSVSAKW